MGARYRWAALALCIALSGGATYGLLKPALLPQTTLLHAASAGSTGGTTAELLTPGPLPQTTAAPTGKITPVPSARGAQAKTRISNYQAGVMVLIVGSDPSFVANIRRKFDYLASLGVNSVGLVFPIFQTNGGSTDVYADPKGTPSSGQIAVFVREAHKRGFTVMLRPLLDEGSLAASGDWRGSIHPQQVEAWFQSYGDLMVTYAALAKDQGIEEFDVGTEFNSLESYGTQWLQVISRVRQAYNRRLTYSSLAGHGYPSKFASGLDFLSVDAYFPLDAKAGATPAELEKAWTPWIGQLKGMATDSGLPLVVTEIGTASQSASYRAPWTAPLGGTLDLEAQRSYYEAACTVLNGMVSGLYWWYMSQYTAPAARTDTGYDPTGKPAEGEIARCFQQP